MSRLRFKSRFTTTLSRLEVESRIVRNTCGRWQLEAEYQSEDMARVSYRASFAQADDKAACDREFGPVRAGAGPGLWVRLRGLFVAH